MITWTFKATERNLNNIELKYFFNLCFSDGFSLSGFYTFIIESYVKLVIIFLIAQHYKI